MDIKRLSKLFTLILVTSFTLISCSGNEDVPTVPISTNIVGKWTYQSNKANVHGNESISTDLGDQISNFVTNYKKNTKGNTYTFSSDGTYVFSSEGNVVVSGTYKLKENSIFELKDEVHNVQTAVIQDKTPKTIYISQDLRDIVIKEFKIDGRRLNTAMLIEAYQ